MADQRDFSGADPVTQHRKPHGPCHADPADALVSPLRPCPPPVCVFWPVERLPSSLPGVQVGGLRGGSSGRRSRHNHRGAWRRCGEPESRHPREVDKTTARTGLVATDDAWSDETTPPRAHFPEHLRMTDFSPSNHPRHRGAPRTLLSV